MNRALFAGVLVAVVLSLGGRALAEVDPPTATWDAFVQQAEQEHGDFGRRAAAFLAAHRPPRDADLDLALLMSNLEYAIKAREEFPWAAAVPEEMFFNDVLPYAVFDETRENWRPTFYANARTIVKDCTTATEAIQALNQQYFKLINVHYNTGRKAPNQSPSESIAQGRATCTGLSIILTYACRSVGIPARGAGVASWHDKRGNHTWVEVWDGRWYFTGADEYNADGLNRAWFTGDAAKAKPGDVTFAVWATSWQDTGHAFPLVWDEASRDVHAVDVTAHYRSDAATPTGSAASDQCAPLAVRHVRVWKGDDRVVATVRAIDAKGEAFGEVTSRAGTADLNDMPSFAFEPNQSYTLETSFDGAVYVTRVIDTSPGDETIDLRLSDESRALTAEEAAQAIDQAWAAEAKKIAEEKAARAADTFEWNGNTMPVLEKVFGDEPADGRSLWISMHGGGGAPAEVNDQQWRNQIRLYEPAEGIYVAPRAPTNTWNLWHQAHIDPLFDQLIATYVATRGVNPDKVYLMGYSAGGDGVYQVAPRMADRFAAASMMAGHPNEAQPLSLRNLPFAIFVGGKDDAYNRNKVCEEWAGKLDALEEADPAGYTHRFTMYPEFGHWMNGKDREVLPWMASKTRNVWPTKVVSYQDDVTHERLYWLEVDKADAAAGRKIVAEVDGQTIRIDSADVSKLTLHLRDELVDLDRPITVIADGQTVFEGMVRRTKDAVARSMAQRRDPRAASTAQLTVSWERPQGG